jgi:addiction module HigA family antidote
MTDMRMYNPPHPGEVVQGLCLDALGLSITAAAKGLKVSRKALSELINGHSGISADMALRLEKAFGSTAEVWLGIQHEYDLWQLRKRQKPTGVIKFSGGKFLESETRVSH